jgi:hypothetical protein
LATNRISHQAAQWYETIIKKISSITQSRWFTWAWLSGLFLAGLLAWLYFFSLGKILFNFHDWADITGPRLAFLKNAVSQGVLPLHITDSIPLNRMSNRFLAVPDQILSPQVLLLRFMPIGWFATFDVILLYAIGFWGLLWLRRRFLLSALPFTILFVLFNFNGNIIAHLGVGHLTWVGSFLFSWFAVLVFQLLDGDRGWVWIGKMSLLLFAIYLQGSFHQYVWALIFLSFLAITKRNHFWTVMGGIVFAILLSMVRILPSALLTKGISNQFPGGYQSLLVIWESLVTIYPTGQKILFVGMGNLRGYWEFSLYAGLVGALFMLYFGFWRWLGQNDDHPKYFELLLPIVGMVIFSLGAVFQYVRYIPFPLIQGERASTRMIIFPFVFILILAVVQFQRWIEQKQPFPIQFYILSVGLFLIGIHDIWSNFMVWRVSQIAEEYSGKPINPMDLRWAVFCLVFLFFLIWRTRSHKSRYFPIDVSNNDTGKDETPVKPGQ